MLPAAEPLPNVTGALLDECGNLVGISLADGVQSLSTSAATQYRWGAALRSVLADLELPVTGRVCSRTPADESLPQPEPADTVVEAPTPPASVPAAAEPAATEIDASGEPELALEELPPIEDEAGDRGSETVPTATDSAPAAWFWLVAALLLLAGGALVRRVRQAVRRPSAAPGDRAEGDDAPDLQTRAAEVEDGWLTASPDSQLVLQGSLADGRPVKASVAVSANAINVEIGRGDCELVISSASVSRRHARVNGTREALTLTDLGSSNGSSINGVPCLEGEIMYLEPGDTVILGDARFTLSIEAVPAGGKNR